MTVVLEPARAFDAPRIGQILSGWIEETDWIPQLHTPAEDQAHARKLIETASVDVARKDGEVVGFLARRGGVVHALYVAPEVRGLGIGADLIGRAKMACNELRLWTFQANDGARRFYARQNFREVEKTDGSANDEKLPDVHLVWTEVPA